MSAAVAAATPSAADLAPAGSPPRSPWQDACPTGLPVGAPAVARAQKGHDYGRAPNHDQVQVDPGTTPHTAASPGPVS